MLDNFKAKTGANTPTYANGRFSVVPPVDGGTTGPASTESALDVEYAGSMAPSSTMGFYEIAVDSTDTIILSSALDTLNEAGSDANNNIAISNSYRLDCENSGSLDPLYNAFQNVFLSNSATGHDYLFASGDEGKACNGVQGDVSYPASSQYVTSVGGTSFTQQLPTTATYVAEKLWTLSGAGNSRRFPLPSWQAGVPGIGTLTYRAIPDVSAIADYGSAETCPSDSSSGCITDGGTSLATPLWAGFVAIINQYVVGHGQQPLGFINPLLYSLAQQVPLYTAIHPMVGQASGSWASPTGLGSPDVWSIARDVTLPGNFAFQAEASRNTISSPAYVVSCGAWPCWGGYAVAGLGNSGNGTDGAVTMNQINVGSEGQYLLTIHYVNPGSGSLRLRPAIDGAAWR